MNAWRHGREIYIEKLEDKRKEKEEREAAALLSAAVDEADNIEQKADVKLEIPPSFKIGKSGLRFKDFSFFTVIFRIILASL